MQETKSNNTQYPTQASFPRSHNSPQQRRKIDPLFLNRLIVARNFNNLDLHEETMEASFMTKGEHSINDSVLQSELNRSLVPERQLINNT